MNASKSSLAWPFADPRDTAVFTVAKILEGWEPILRVTHDAEDGAWQFLPGHDRFNEQDARVVALEQIVALDHSVALVANLPLGGRAWRKAAHLPWQRATETKDS